MLWLAAQTYLLCLASFIAGVVLTVLVLRNRRPATEEEPVAEEEPAIDDEPSESQTVEIDPVIVKGSKKSMRYHTPDSPYYNRLKGDVIFESVADAEEAGYTAWKTPART